MTWAEEVERIKKAFRESVVKMKEEQRKSLSKMIGAEKEATTMQVSYNGFIGELVKLERVSATINHDGSYEFYYDLSIFDGDKQVTHSFTGVKLENVKFLGGVMSFGA